MLLLGSGLLLLAAGVHRVGADRGVLGRRVRPCLRRARRTSRAIEHLSAGGSTGVAALDDVDSPVLWLPRVSQSEVPPPLPRSRRRQLHLLPTTIRSAYLVLADTRVDHGLLLLLVLLLLLEERVAGEGALEVLLAVREL